MTPQTLQIVFAIGMVVLCLIGFYCAARLNGDYPLWVRMIVLYPALAAMCTLGAMLRGHYVAYRQDIIMAVGVVLIYALVASLFSARPWLDMRVKQGDQP
jgi:O-antigen/teichoic acid export membrane protein